MAEAYRGLTIRIGADTSNLRQAMSQLRHASYSLQSDFRKMSKAFRLDPSNAKLALATTRSLKEAIGATAAETSRLNTAMRQVGQQAAIGMKGTSIEQLAGFTRNAKLEASYATESYNRLDKELEQVYMAVAKYRSANVKGAGSYESELKEIKELSHAWNDSASRVKVYKRIRDAIGNGNFNPWGISKKAGMSLSQTYEEAFTKIRNEWTKTEQRLERANQVVGFQNIKNDAALAEAEIKRLAAEFTKLHAEEMKIGRGNIQFLKTDIDNAKSSVMEAEQRLKKLDEALNLDPHNIEAANQKMVAFKERTAATERELAKAEQRLKEMEAKGFGKLVSQAEKLGKSVEQVENEFTEANAKVEKLKGQLEEAKFYARELRESGKGGSKAYKEAAEEVKKLKAQLEAADKAADKVREDFEIIEKSNAFREQAADIQLAKSRLAAYNRELRETNMAALANAGKSMKNLGYAGLSTVFPIATMGAMYMVQAADEVDAAYRDMRKTVQGTETDFEELRQGAMDFASTHVTSTGQLLEIEAIGGQLGIAVENLEAFGETVANLDIATNMNTEDIAADLGKMGSVLGMTSDDYDNFGDSLVRLGNNMPAFESDIMTITTRFMGMGKVVGMTAPEMLAWATAATATGQKAEAAGSSMQRFVSNVETAVTDGGEKLELFAQVAGMSADEFAAKFNDDASSAMYDFVYGLGEMQRNGESVNQVLSDLGINNVRDKQLLEGLANQMANATGETNLLNDALTMSQDAWNGVGDEWGAAGDAAREAQRKSEGFSGQLQILKNNAQVLFVEMSEGLVPILTRINDIVQTVTDRFSSMSDRTKTTIIALAGIGTAMVPMSVMSGVVMSSLVGMIGQLDKMDTAFGKVEKHERSIGRKSRMVSYYKTLTSALSGADVAVDTSVGRFKKMVTASQRVSRGLTLMGKAAKLAAISFGPMLALTAVVAVLGIVGSKISEAREHARALEKATKGLENSTKSLGNGFSYAAGRIGAYGKESSGAALSVDELTESLGEHADRINEISRDTGATLGQLDAWQETLNRAIQDPDWGQEHIGEVTMAVQGINSELGTQYDAQRLISGEYESQLDLINRQIEAQKQQIQQQAAQEIVIESTKAQWEAQQAYEQAYDEWLEKKEQYERDPDWKNKREFEDAAEDLEEAEDMLASANETLSDSYDLLNENSHLYSSAEEIANFLQSADLDIFEGLPDADKMQELGVSYDDFAASLERFGVSTADLAAMNPADIAALIEAYASGGDEGVYNMLESMGVTLESTNEKAGELQHTMFTIGNSSYEYQISDDGTISREGEKLEGFQAYQIDGKWYAISDDGTVYDATHQLDELEAQQIRDKAFAVNADTSSAWSKINALANSHVSATVDVTPRIQSLKNAIDNFFGTHSWSATVKPSITAGGHAAGGLIPAHAAGGFNGIVTKPLFTNQGLIGEAGAEAVMRWAGGTAIVPLQNRQYVRPFAQTVAQEMPGAFGMYRGATAGEIAAALAQLDLQVRMDSGELVGVLVSNSQRRAAMNVG